MRQLIKSYGSQFGCGVTNRGHHNNLTSTRPAWTAFEKRWKSWRNRTASNCEGHKKDTAGLAPTAVRIMGRCLGFDRLPTHVVHVPLPERSMTRQRVGFESALCCGLCLSLPSLPRRTLSLPGSSHLRPARPLRRGNPLASRCTDRPALASFC